MANCNLRALGGPVIQMAGWAIGFGRCLWCKKMTVGLDGIVIPSKWLWIPLELDFRVLAVSSREVAWLPS